MNVFTNLLQRLLFSLLFNLCVFFSVVVAQNNGPLRVCQDNPRYFTDNSGKAIYLTGSHTWASFSDQGPTDPPDPFEWTQYLDWLKGTNQNYLRLWLREQFMHSTEIGGSWYLSPQSAYVRTGPGNAKDGGLKFNLDSISTSWLDRLYTRCVEAKEKGIFISIVFFDGWGIQAGRCGSVVTRIFDYHPYSSANNVNSISADPNNDGSGELIHTKNASINAYQFNYVKTIIDKVNDLDNILYEIGNECSYPSASQTDPWIRMMIDTIHAYELRKPKQHPVGYSGDWTIPNSYLTSSNNHSDYVAFAAGNNGNDYESSPPANDGKKVVILDTDHLWGVPDGSSNGSRKWIWKAFTRGHNVNSMDPWNSDSYGNFCGIHFDTSQSWWRSFRKNLGYTNLYAKKINLTAMTPQDNLSSTSYCLATSSVKNAEYLIYNPSSSGSITVDLSATTDSITVEWFNPGTGETIRASNVKGGSSKMFTPPFSNDAVLYLTAIPTVDDVSSNSQPAVPFQMEVLQNYPNPFNNSTIIQYAVPTESRVIIKIFDISGKEIALLVDTVAEPGYHKTSWTATASGVYFCKIEAVTSDSPVKHFTDVKKMVVLK